MLPQTAFTGLTVGHTYTVTVNANGADGSQTSNTASFTAAALQPPTAVPATVSFTGATGSTIVASWPAVPAASGYQLFVGTNAATLLAQPPIFTTGTTRTLTGLTPGGSYVLAVRPINQAGRGPASTPQNFLSLSPPPAPASVTLTPGVQQLTAIWPDVSGATSYTVRYMPGQASAFDPNSGTAITNATSPTVISGLVGGQTYAIGVSASNAAGSSTFTIADASPDVPPAPSNLQASPAPTQAILTWDSVPGASNYELGYHSGSSFVPSSATIIPVSDTSYTLTGLTAGQSYVAAVRTVMNGQSSAWSATVLILTQNSYFYRDGRDLTGILTDCNTGRWEFQRDIGTCSGGTYSNAGAIDVAQTNSIAPATFNPNGLLLPTTYHAWAYGKRGTWASGDISNIRLQLTHNGQTLIGTPPPEQLWVVLPGERDCRSHETHQLRRNRHRPQYRRLCQRDLLHHRIRNPNQHSQWTKRRQYAKSHRALDATCGNDT